MTTLSFLVLAVVIVVLVRLNYVITLLVILVELVYIIVLLFLVALLNWVSSTLLCIIGIEQ